MTDRKGDWMQTASGRAYWPLDPRPEEVDINDIAHALSHICRFGGHCNGFYSVAEHSVLVSKVVSEEHALAGLLHDATEAYLIDVPRPIKKHLADYATIEDLNWQVIARKFGLPNELPAEVKDADNAVLLAERDQIMNPPVYPWNLPGEPANVVVKGVHPYMARTLFLERFEELMHAYA